MTSSAVMGSRQKLLSGFFPLRGCQNGRPNCCWSFGTLLGPFGPFWTISNKNWFFAPKHIRQTLLCSIGAKNSKLCNCAICDTLYVFQFLHQQKLTSKSEKKRISFSGLEVDFKILNSKTSPCLLQKNMLWYQKNLPKLQNFVRCFDIPRRLHPLSFWD